MEPRATGITTLVRDDAVDRAAGPARFRLTEADHAGVWDDLARTSPGGTPFHLWDFLDLQERMLGIHVERRLLTMEGVAVGIWPVARRSQRSPRAPWTPFPFLGPAVQPDHLAAAMQQFRRWQWRSGLALARFDVAPALAAAADRRLPGSPMSVVRDGTVVIDLAHGSADALDAAMSKGRRKGIRRAGEAGVAARTAEPGETARLLGRVLSEAYGRRGRPSPYPADVGGRLEAWAEGRDDVHLGTVDVEGVASGSLVTLTGHPIAIPWIGASLPEVRESNAEAVLLRGGMVEALRRGCTSWDFGGRVDAGVEQFKLSFGGTTAPYLTVESLLGPRSLRDALARRRG